MTGVGVVLKGSVVGLTETVETVDDDMGVSVDDIDDDIRVV